MKKQYARASFRDIFKYSFGGVGSNLAFFLVLSYLTYFYTDIFGIDTKIVAGLMLVSRLIDAFTDPLMGIIADHTRSRMGRYRPWIIFGAPGLGITMYLLFTAPELSPTMKIVYVYIIYIVYSLVSTVVNIPYHSLTPVLSEDPDQRTVIVTWKQGMGAVSQFIITILGLPLVNLFGGGKTGWGLYGALIGLLTTVSFWVCAAGGKEYDVSNVSETKVPFSLKKDMKLVFGNKPLIMLMIAFGTDVLANATYSAANMYYFKYVLHRLDLVPTVASAILFAGLVSIPLLPLLSRLLGKKWLYWFGSFFSIFPLVVMWLHPTAPVVILMCMMAAFGFMSRIPSNMGWALLPECVDWAEWKYGARGEGLITSSLTFINKFGMAVGGFLASFLLGVAGYAANQEQSQGAIAMIVFLRFGMPVLGYVASVISMVFYEITNEKYADIRRDLDARRS